MREVAILGIGQTSVEEHWDKSLRELATQAVVNAMLDAQRDRVDGIFIGNMMSGMVSRQENLGALVADWSGLGGVEAFKVEAACGSGAAAIHLGVMAIASGYMNAVIAMGVEKMTDTSMSETTAALATAADADFEGDQGVSFVSLNALIMQRYLYEFKWKHTDFARFSINAHENAMSNPNARLHDRISEAEYRKARMICDPINLLDASPTGDGAAALLMVPLESLRSNGRPRIVIAGSTASTDSIAIHDRKDGLWLSAAYSSACKAYEQAGVQPEDIDLFELHDAFSIMAALSLEACGFAERGQGTRLAVDGQICPGGRIPIATRGGLKARGHPVGATGVYQIAEIVQQLRGEAEKKQIQDAKIGMAQNFGVFQPRPCVVILVLYGYTVDLEGGDMKTKMLPAYPDAKSPAGADIRFLMDGETGNMIHSTVPPHQVNKATVHATVSEFWYVLEGEGEIWRDDSVESCIAALIPGTSIDIPVGTKFQYRNVSDVELKFICITMPPWPGDSEATYVKGKWPPTI